MSLFTAINAVNSDPNLPVLNNNDVRPLFQGEAGSYGHWIFDSGQSALLSKSGNKTLSIQGNAPTYNTSHLTVEGVGNSLQTDLVDSLVQEVTMCAVFRVQTLNQLTIIMGNLGTSGNGGLSPYLTDNGSLFFNARGFGMAAFTKLEFYQPGQWLFLAWSIKTSSTTGDFTTKISGFPVQKASNLSGPYQSSPGVPFSIGNAAYTAAGGSGNAIDVAEFIIYDKELSPNEMEALYQRSKLRMEGRGITVV